MEWGSVIWAKYSKGLVIYVQVKSDPLLTFLVTILLNGAISMSVGNLQKHMLVYSIY